MPLVFGWLLNGVYLLIVAAIAPVILYRRWTKGKYRRGWKEKLTGRITRQFPDKRCLWFHAVSVGEVLQLPKVIDETASRYPDAELFISVTTETGYDVARSKFPNHTVSYFPLDFTWAVDRALASMRPDLIVLVELELWPNFILSAWRRKIPLLLVNGRIGEKSFRGYCRIKPLMSRLLSCFRWLGVQTEVYGERLCTLGAPADRVVVTGNIKFDRVESNRDNAKTNELRISFGLDRDDLVFIAGSTQEPEEAFAIQTWLKLRSQFPFLRLIVVPRHQERFDEVANLIKQQGCHVIRRSVLKSSGTVVTASDHRGQQPTVLLLDTLGELLACWGLADIAFVGGSLGQRGGQNMLEPAAYGAAVLFGPNTWNFQDITQALLSRSAARVVTDANSMLTTVRDLILHPQQVHQLGDAARAFVASQQGATQRTLELIVSAVKQ